MERLLWVCGLMAAATVLFLIATEVIFEAAI